MTDDSGQEVSINNKCAEMDREVPMLMGVSKAIMENVIFCHQDEALWPFSDQANLKKIFDEIFDTAKYTKILVEMRDNSKQFNKKSKDLQQEVEILFTHYQQFQTLKIEMEERQINIEKLHQEMLGQENEAKEF